MSLSVPAKAVTGALVGGTVATGGSLLYKELSKPQTHLIKDLLALNNPEKRLISTSDAGSTTEWRASWKEYRSAYKGKANNPFSMTSEQLNVTGDNVDAPTEFINVCRSLSTESVIDNKDDRYKTILSYCTRDTLVSDLIKETSVRSLLVKGSDFTNNAEWKRVWGSYKEANKTLNQDEWNLGTWSTLKNQDNVPDALATQCDSKSKVKEHKLNSKTYTDVLKYCTKAE
ncbi:hypothetical protein MHF_0295 [Mycoplasma haemofelis Ohio2]|uniref:Uncharacterized protein n=1 Tax=Mycoplasma haemofelis (strain Ohio2) TaxID=859194 RepID=F6FGQ4_MYCHI|nr:hypothetical protein MHF_0295 [Mycoplasma haemofelis Ohio2]